jgi:hypothetical protein
MIGDVFILHKFMFRKLLIGKGEEELSSFSLNLVTDSTQDKGGSFFLRNKHLNLKKKIKSLSLHY